MKIVTAEELCESYTALYGEGPITPDKVQIFANWLDRYRANPRDALGTQNWHGKVTCALFYALKLKQPKTKREMLLTLEGTCQQ